MEEVDKIIIQSLISVGCEISPDIKSLGQFDQDLFIEAVAKLLNTINAGSENLPTKLPPNTGVKYRICTRFGNVCQQLGYKNEIGYQTFLYTNEMDMRRLLMFLSEKLAKEMSTSHGSSDHTELNTKKAKNLNILIAQQLKKDLNKIWLPPYCKLNSLRIEENGSFCKEGCKFLKRHYTFSPVFPNKFSKDKTNFSQETNDYFENHLKYVNRQITRQPVDVLVSLIQHNALQNIKEQAILRNDSLDEIQKTLKLNAVKSLKNAIKENLKKIEEINNTMSDNNQNRACLSKSDLAEIEQSLQSPNKNFDLKGSRFTHSEKLQFTKDESDKPVSVISNTSEEKKEEEIKNLKETLDNLNNNYESLESEIKKLNSLVAKLEQDTLDQEELNKKLLEKIAVKQKTINLINDAPANIQKLQDEINNHENKMIALKSKFESHKYPLEEEKENLKQLLSNQKQQMELKNEEIKRLRQEIDELNTDLTSKENLIKELNNELDNIPKESTKFSNRQFYTKRILEIVANIDKQKKEIDKILIETKSIQKEINQLSGKLERIFNATDELIFKDAKKDETNKKVYKLFININDSYDQLIKKIEESSQINREIKDLEDQINSESQNKVADNMSMVLKDYKQIKEENEQLASKLKAAKSQTTKKEKLKEIIASSSNEIYKLDVV